MNATYEMLCHAAKIAEECRERSDSFEQRFFAFDFLRTNEVLLSKLIAELLNPKGKHGQKAHFLRLFLSVMSIEIDEQKIDLTKIRVTPEKPTDHGRKIDIYIEFGKDKDAPLIAIELKPYSRESKDQIRDYWCYVKEQARLATQKPYLIFVHWNGDEPETISESKRTDLIGNRCLHLCSFADLSDKKRGVPSISQWLSRSIEEGKRLKKPMPDRLVWFLEEFDHFLSRVFAMIPTENEATTLMNKLEGDSNKQSAAHWIASRYWQFLEDATNRLLQKADRCKKEWRRDRTLSDDFGFSSSEKIGGKEYKTIIGIENANNEKPIKKLWIGISVEGTDDEKKRFFEQVKGKLPNDRSVEFVESWKVAWWYVCDNVPEQNWLEAITSDECSEKVASELQILRQEVLNLRGGTGNEVGS